MHTRMYPHSCFPELAKLGYWEKKSCRDISLPYFFISGPPWHSQKSVHIAVKEVKATHADICELNFNEKNTLSAAKEGKTVPLHKQNH